MDTTNDSNEFDTALYVPDATKYWFVRADSHARFYDDFQLNNFIAVGGNDVTLEELLLIESRYRVTPDILKNRYKAIFNNIFMNNLIEEYQEKQKEMPEELPATTKKRATAAGTNSFMFIEEMHLGDIILVPFRSSSKFLVGVVMSDVFDEPIDHIRLDGEDESYTISDFDKKRRVLWIKEITQRDLPDKLKWIRYAHQTLFNITEFAEFINLLIAPKVVYKGQFYSRIGVETDAPVSDDDLFQFQKVVQEAKKPGLKISQKTKVQSHGDFIQNVLQSDWKSLVAIGSVLFGSANIKAIEVKGIIPLLYDRWNKEAIYKRKANIAKSKQEIAEAEAKTAAIVANSSAAEYQAQLAAAEVESTQLDNKLKQEQLRKERLENKKREREIISDVRFNDLLHKELLTDDTQLPDASLSPEGVEMVGNLMLTDSPVGTEMTIQTQMDKVIEVEG